MTSRQRVLSALDHKEPDRIPLFGPNIIQTHEPRDEARYRQAMEILQETGLLDPCGYEGNVFRITHDGYLLADQLLALRARKAEE